MPVDVSDHKIGEREMEKKGENDKQNRSAWALPDRSLRKARPDKQAGQAKILPHYPHVILYVYMSRYATVDHIQRRFSGTIKSLRTAQYQLARLIDLGFLKTVEVTSTSPNFPHVYVATGRGVSHVRKRFKVELTEAREEATSLASITHELFLTAFELACWQTVKTRPDLSLKMTERRYFHQQRRLKYPVSGRSQHLIPDAGFLLSVERGQGPLSLLHFFAELDNGTELPSVVLTKFRKYVAWTESEHGRNYLLDLYRRHGAAKPKPNYRLLVIARRRGQTGQDDRRVADLFTQALELPEAMRNRIWFASVDDLMSHEHDQAPLASDLWIRVADTNTWLNDYRAYVATLPTGKGYKSSQNKRDYVAEKLPAMPRHPMFPSPLTK